MADPDTNQSYVPRSEPLAAFHGALWTNLAGELLCYDGDLCEWLPEKEWLARQVEAKVR